jgi:hypothetical protein
MTTQDTGAHDPAARFGAIYVDECSAVRARRKGAGQPSDPTRPLTDLRGLALSGGGIRSATFCLGVLQQLAAEGRLGCFDYLSTVSGGGFIGGWWSAWLSRSEHRETEGEQAGAPAIFPDAERIELDRQGHPGDYTPDGSRSAGADPIHHVRLFSNYLTPRKGALSADTWRAITVVSRNLLITLLTLLPILGSGVFLAQFYFVGDENLAAAFVCGAPPNPAAGGAAVAAARPRVCTQFESSMQAHPWDLKVRFARALVPIVVLLAWLALVTLYWTLAGTGDVVLAAFASLGVLVMLVLVKRDIGIGDGTGIAAEMLKDTWFLPLLIGGAGVLTAWTVYLGRRRVRLGDTPTDATRLSASQGEVLTNHLTRVQTMILIALSVATVVLLFGGFGHELVRVALMKGQEGVGAFVIKAGGWGAAALALGGAIFTAFKAAPTGGADASGAEPGRKTALILAVTPPLLMVVLLLALANGSHALLATLPGPRQGVMSSLHVALLVAMAICVLFACYEYIADEPPRGGRIWTVVAALALGAVAWALPLPQDRPWATAIAGLGLGVVTIPWLTFELMPRLRRFLEDQSRLNLSKARPRVWATMVLLGVPLGMAAAGWGLGTISRTVGQGHIIVTQASLGGMMFSAALLALLPVASRRPNLRTMWLLTLVYALLGTLYVEQFLDPTKPQVLFPQAIVAFIGVALASVVGLGWLTDPNYLSLHTFYRARLVRAYLGASNEARLTAEITESVDGDDIQLADLVKGSRPAPYHLINTTLNLVAGRDLATAQRSAAAFTLSPHHCGSLRTGYRPTQAYMGGRLTLGTALAVSGAAASPNMGSKTTSAALAMLMALLNVRLGFWAPNPAKERWKVPRPRLWPFYVLREFLSQTNDLSSYCYLTDGGHFDNTGLYSLVQRGCRSIFLVDCGADPTPCFADLGDAIRRCRIDFRAEITLSVNEFIRTKDSRLSDTHFVVGEVVYDREHVRQLGWGDVPNAAARKGVIVWLKPSLLDKDPAEVRQYALENNVFPQQTTADQWFDEAQFESYRRLGVECAKAAIADSRVDPAFPVI